MKETKLKRITVSSKEELERQLRKIPDSHMSLMLTLFAKTSPKKHIPGEVLEEALSRHGWIKGERSTLSKDLIAQVIHRKR